MTKNTKIIIIDDVTDAEVEMLQERLTEGGYSVTVKDGEETSTNDVEAMSMLFNPSDYRFERIEKLAKELLIASQEREGMSHTTEASKLEALACFFIAANFQTVSDALVHSFGDEPFPVGKGFDEFVLNFLGPEGYEKAVS